jgi:carbon-monoxide dehydrogenase medium subunit
MARVKEVHRPETVAEALALLARSDRPGLPLAGGTGLVPRLVSADNAVEAAVDLSLLGLGFIALERGMLRLGATATLAEVAENEICASMAGGLLSRAARLSADVNVRNAATVGGTVVAGHRSPELLLALLLLDAKVLIQTLSGEHVMPLGGFLHAPAQALNQDPSADSGGGLLTEVRFFPPEGDVGTGWARVGRTPRDRPIVAAAALVAPEGDGAAQVRLALGGVASVPIRATSAEEALVGRPFSPEALTEALGDLAETLDPPGDFRGSAEYRRAVAPILARRALREAWAVARGRYGP